MILKAEGLTKHFGGLKAVDGVDLEIQEGEVRSIIGPNGAGKTSLFNLLTGYLRCSSGKIFWKGKDITHLSAPDLVRLGIVRTFQRTNIFPNITVRENVLVPLLRMHGRSWNPDARPLGLGQLFREEIEVLLGNVGLSGHSETVASTLSHGGQRCLELAIALANGPSVLMLDEPTAGMSVGESATMMNLLTGINEQMGMTILLTEHDMNVVFSVSQEITVLHFGKIIAQGTPEEIRNNGEVQRIYLGEPE